jgi:hypothetical protein
VPDTGGPGLSRPELLRRRAAEERRKAREVERLLSRLEARLAGAPAGGRRRPGETDSPRDRRGFNRQAADLVIRYRWPERHAPLIGRVRDISRGGVRFMSSRQLAPGTLLQASLHAPGGPGPQFEGQMYLEVVHCRRNNDLWDVGARFRPMPAESFRGSERRRHRRFGVSLDVAFRLSGEEESPPRRGTVRDISRGGMRFRCDARLNAGTLVAAVVSGAQRTASAGAGTSIRVSALVQVTRCRKVGGHFEIGGRFVG